MRIGFRFITSDFIEKSKKGTRRSKHKYIRVFTGNNGKDEYIYPADMKNPFKKLLSIFAITKERISKVFKSENIEENYGVDEVTFAAHILEYLSARAKWDKFFSEPVNSHVNKKPVNLNKKKDQTGRKVEEKKPEENKDGKIKINRSLMRKVWAIFNPAKEFETELSFNAKAGPVAATTEVVNVAEDTPIMEEDTENLSQAMMGNDNAKKDFIEEETEKDAEKTAADKAEFNMLVSRLVELDKEYKANGGDSLRHNTTEQEIKRREASKERRTVERKLEDFSKRIEEENFGNYQISEVYKDTVNAWLKRLAKGQSISWNWINKNFGGQYHTKITFGDGLELDYSGIKNINNPLIRMNWTDNKGYYGYSIISVEEMSKDTYTPNFMPHYGNQDMWNEVYKRFLDIREKINSNSGSTPAEKFYNMILGEDNEYNKSNGLSADIPRYRFTKDGIKGKDGKLVKVSADLRNEGTPNEGIQMYGDGYGDDIPSIFYPKNDTDTMTDYFEHDRAWVTPDNPYYNHLKVMALKKRLYRGRATKWDKMSEEDQKKLENQIKELEKTLTEPTGEELAEYRTRRDHEEEVKEKWEESKRNVYRKEREEREEKQVKETTEKLYDLMGKLAAAMEKEPPVDLNGLSKQEKIDTLEDRIFKLGVEINNISDPETVESKIKFRDRLNEVLTQVRNEPETAPEVIITPETPVRTSTEISNELADVKRKMFTAEDEELEGLRTRLTELGAELKEAKAREISAEEHANRSAAMMGNQNAYKGMTDTQLKLKQKQLGEEIGRIYAENEKLYDDNSGFSRGSDDDPNSDYQKWVRNAQRGRELKEEVSKITDERKSRGVTDEERNVILLDHNAAYKGIKPETPKPEKTPTEQLRETVEEKTEEPEEKDTPVDTVYTPMPTINSEVTRRINDISMMGTSGNYYHSAANGEMKEFREMFDTSKMNEQQLEYFQERLNSYAALVGSSYNEMASKRLSAGPSWVVAGPAKFNNKRYAQKMDAEIRAGEVFQEKKEKFIKNTEKELKRLKYQGGSESEDEVKNRVFEDYANGKYSYGDKIDNTDPYAIEKISGKIKYMENAHEVTLLYRKNCKSSGIPTQSWADRTEEDNQKRKAVMLETIKAAKEKGYTDRQIKQGMEHPFPQNQNQDIARNKKRLEELKARKAAIDVMNTVSEDGTTAAANTGRVDFDGGYIYENLGMDRIQIIYDEKPDRETINKLKHSGFRWSPSQGAWQRQLNRNGRSAVNNIMAETGKDVKIDIDGAGEVKKADMKEDEMFIKAFEFCDFYLGKSYNIGDLRTWKGKVFKLNKSGSWERFI